jgi:hypothetical protein
MLPVLRLTGPGRADRRLGAAEDCVSSVDLSAQIIYFCASQALHVKTRLSRAALILRVRPALRVYGRRTRRPCWSRGHRASGACGQVFSGGRRLGGRGVDSGKVAREEVCELGDGRLDVLLFVVEVVVAGAVDPVEFPGAGGVLEGLDACGPSPRVSAGAGRPTPAAGPGPPQGPG